MSSLCLGFCFLSLSGLEEDSSTTCMCQLEGRVVMEAEWEPTTAKGGNRGTLKGDNFLPQLPNLRIISSSVGWKGFK